MSSGWGSELTELIPLGLVIALVAAGLTTLMAEVRLGIEHAPHAGERYVPTWQRGATVAEDAR